MKILLRLLVIFVSLGIVVMALLPPEKEETVKKKSPSEKSEPTPLPVSTQDTLKDLLGGKAIESGKQAKEDIDRLNARLEKIFIDPDAAEEE